MPIRLTVQIAKEVAAAVRAAAPRVAELDRKRKADLASRLTARWQRWELSNFDYLMQLNTLAGAAMSCLSARSITLACCYVVCYSHRLSYVPHVEASPQSLHHLPWHAHIERLGGESSDCSCSLVCSACTVFGSCDLPPQLHAC